MKTDNLASELENGICLPGQDVVAADLVAIISGVNLASVNKIIRAIKIATCSLNVPYEVLLSTGALPAGRADSARLFNTERLAKKLVTSPSAIAEEQHLHFIERMSRRR
jgi:hypothetical protein